MWEGAVSLMISVQETGCTWRAWQAVGLAGWSPPQDRALWYQACNSWCNLQWEAEVCSCRGGRPWEGLPGKAAIG